MFTLPDLPYDYKALEPYIDEETMHLHHDKHHAAYVKNLNAALETKPELLQKPIEEIIANLNSLNLDPITLSKVKNNGGGHANHSFFWQIMTPNPKENPPARDSELIKAITQTFGSPETLKEKFTAVAMARFGSGWAWLVINEEKLEITDTPNQDSPLTEGKTPLLALDAWEHAYYLKYQNRRADYIAAWWNIVNWHQVEENFKNGTK